MYVDNRDFPKTVSDWMVAVLPADQKSGLKLLIHLVQFSISYLKMAYFTSAWTQKKLKIVDEWSTDKQKLPQCPMLLIEINKKNQHMG